MTILYTTNGCLEYLLMKKEIYEIKENEVLLNSYYNNPSVLELYIFEDELGKNGKISEWAKKELLDQRWVIHYENNNDKKWIKLER